MTLNRFFLGLIILISLAGCIGDDFVDDEVDPVLRITTLVDTIEINTSFQFEHSFFDNIGQEQNVTANWSSSDPDIISIDENGLATAINEGSATLKSEVNFDGVTVSDEHTVVVGQSTISTLQMTSGQINTTTFYTLEGDFNFNETEEGVEIIVMDNYVASADLPDLRIYLSNNRNSIANALEIGRVEVFSGAHSYDIPGVGFSDFQFIIYFCKPFNVKVGEAIL